MNLKGLRKKIDHIDGQMVRLLNQRARYSQQIGQLKKNKNQLVYVPDREKAVFGRIKKLNKGPVKNSSLLAIYREIMSSSLSLEKDMKVAYLGPEYTFSHQASVKKFGHSVEYVPCLNIADIFSIVEVGQCDYGVVPVENSTEGAIYNTLDMFVDSDLKICSEITFGINLNLLSKEKSLKGIRKIYSNPQVFGQCRRWLESQIPKAELLPMPSTAQSALKSAATKNSACIASSLAAEESGLRVIAPSIQDSATNTTRFLILSCEAAKPTGCDKTSIVMSVKDKPGSLQMVLKPFEKNKINLSKIESRPSKRKEWEYVFFIDIEGHIEDKKVQLAIKSANAHTTNLKILGSHPKA